MILNLLSQAAGSTGDSTAQTGGGYGTYIMLALVVVVLIVMMVVSGRANKKRQAEAQAKLDGMRVGDRVKTIGGICGVVVEIDDEENTFVLETGVNNSGSFIKFDKVAVYQTSHPEDEEPAEQPEVEDAPEAAEEASAEEIIEAVDEDKE